MFDIFFFFNDTATTEIYTLSLHDALPIYGDRAPVRGRDDAHRRRRRDLPRFVPALGHEVQGQARQGPFSPRPRRPDRSEEHTSELQSRQYLVCRLLLEKKKQ